MSGDEHWSGLMHFDCVSSKTVPEDRSSQIQSDMLQRAMQSGAGSLQVDGQAEAHVY